MRKKSANQHFKGLSTNDGVSLDVVTKAFPKPSEATKTTFQLTEQGYEALNRLADRFSANIGEVIERLIHIMNTLGCMDDFLRACAENPVSGTRIRRSHKVKTETLARLNQMRKLGSASGYSISRDDLLESMACSVWRVLGEQREKEKELLAKARDRYSKACKTFLSEVAAIDHMFSDIPDSPIRSRLNYIDLFVTSLDSDLDEAVESGVPLDPNKIS